MQILTKEQLERRLNPSNNLLARDSFLETPVDPTPIALTPDTTGSPVAEREVINPELVVEERKGVGWNGGRTPGANGIPDFLRVMIGTQAHLTTTSNVAEAFGVSPSTVHEAKHGRISGETVPELKEAVNENVEAVHKLAMERLLKTLGVITDEKLEGLNAKDASTVAANISRVMEKTMPKGQGDGASRIILVTPTLKTETHYTTVTVKNND